MKRALVAVLPAVLALGLVACGDDDDAPDTVPVTADEGAGDVTLPGGGTLPDITMPDITMPDITLPGGSTLPDFSDVTMPDLSNISVPEGMIENLLRDALPQLSDEQVSCLADELGNNLDLSRVPEIAETCDIDAADVGG